MAMTVTALIDELIFRTESEFIDRDDLTDALNASQIEVVSRADDELLTDLLTKSTASAFDANISASLPSDLLAMRIQDVQQVQTPYNLYEVISMAEARKIMKSSYLRPKRANAPKGYFFGGKFYSLCSDDSAVTNSVYYSYIKVPTDMVADTGSCALNEVLREPLLLLAESYLWRSDDELERASDVYTKALQYLQTLNKQDTEALTENLQKQQVRKVKEEMP